ncbi:MAG: amino acid dehydrogenase [Saprospiraceae bacterium]|nr:amino acid dehydrogenase [Saprospiraceae bacterium]
MSLALDAFMGREPELVLEWKDPQSEAKAWLVIHSLKGGAAGGGTRMRKGLTRDEVVKLAKTMEVKFRVSGPSIGGAKSGIDFDPSDPRKPEVLRRWYAAIRPMLLNCYGTAGDLNVDERLEVRPMLEALGIRHPQQGVLTGHFALDEAGQHRVLERLRKGTSLFVNSREYSPDPGANRYTATDLITGYGLYAAVKTYWEEVEGTGLKSRKIGIQGWGNVGAAAGWYLARAGARIAFIQDKEHYLHSPEGMSFEQVHALFDDRKGNALPPGQGQRNPPGSEWPDKLQLDAFLPAAASRLVTESLANKLIERGLQLIACGANVAFDEEELIFGSLTRKLDHQIAIIPDFIANCGVARLFSFLMGSELPVSEEAIFEDVGNTVRQAVLRIAKASGGKHTLVQTALNEYII